MKIVITESKKEKMSSLVEKSLKAMGKLMQCIEDLDSSSYGNRDEDWEDDDDDDDFGQRGGYSGRSNYGMRGGGAYGNRDGMMGERRGVRGTGPYSRYR